MSPMQPVSLITGASSGIGAALARIFAAHGHHVAVTARREPQLTALADEIASAGHARPQVIAADLAAADGPARIAAALAQHGLEPAFVVNNAGFGLLGDAAALDRAEELAMVDVNCRALTDLSLRWTDSLKRHRGGILNVASIASFLPGPGMAVYHATKAYVLSLSEALHEELKADGVRVCALCPGPVETEFFARAGIPSGYIPGVLECPAEKVARAGYDGMMGGHRVVVPGKLNRLVTLLPRIVPRGPMLAGAARSWNRQRRRRR
jgi:uncharacterized protein